MTARDSRDLVVKPDHEWRVIRLRALPLLKVEPDHDNHLPSATPSDVTREARCGGFRHDG